MNGYFCMTKDQEHFTLVRPSRVTQYHCFRHSRGITRFNELQWRKWPWLRAGGRFHQDARRLNAKNADT